MQAMKFLLKLLADFSLLIRYMGEMRFEIHTNNVLDWDHQQKEKNHDLRMIYIRQGKKVEYCLDNEQQTAVTANLQGTQVILLASLIVRPILVCTNCLNQSNLLQAIK